MKPVVHRIREGDPGYGTPSARVFPWLVFTRKPDRPLSMRAFRTWDRAMNFALRKDLG